METNNTTNTYNDNEPVDVNRRDEEPATKHDVTEGGVIGAVGGGVVGALAGGPVGAVVGAVLGGAGSAGAVGAVDKHDHDYGRTKDTDYQDVDLRRNDDTTLVDTDADGDAEVYPGRLPADNDYGQTTAAGSVPTDNRS